jgi:hypothetical protein
VLYRHKQHLPQTCQTVPSFKIPFIKSTKLATETLIVETLLTICPTTVVTLAEPASYLELSAEGNLVLPFLQILRGHHLRLHSKNLVVVVSIVGWIRSSYQHYVSLHDTSWWL